MRFTINPGAILRWLLGITALLMALSIVVQLVAVVTGHGRLLGLGRLLNADCEASIPTCYSASLLLLCSLLSSVIWATKREAKGQYARHWQILAVVFLYLSVDELTSIHEAVGNTWIHASGNLLNLGWTLPFAVLVAVFAFSYLRFLFSLPVSTRRLLIAAGTLYVGSALGIEAVGGFWRTFHGEGGAVYVLMNSVEEAGEMAGTVILSYALTRYLAGSSPSLDVLITDAPGRKTEEVPSDRVPPKTQAGTTHLS